MSMGYQTDNATITNVTFVIGLAPGAPAMDLTKMKIVFSTPTTDSGNPYTGRLLQVQLSLPLKLGSHSQSLQ